MNKDHGYGHDAEGRYHVVDVCERCQDRHERPVSPHKRWLTPTCTAHRSYGRGPCRRIAIKGGKVCPTHNGRQKHVAANAKHNHEVSEAEKRAAKALTNINPDSKYFANPLAGLLQEVAISAQAVEWYAERIAELKVPTPNETEAATVDEIFEHLDRIGRPIFGRQEAGDVWGYDSDGETAMHVLIKMWNEERDRHVRNCAAAIKAGVAERMVALAENQGMMIARAFTRLIEQLPLDQKQRAAARELAAAELRALPAMSTVIDVPTVA